MPQTVSLPLLTSIPDNIDEQLRHLLQQQPHNPALGEWLYELIRASGHLSTPDSLRWRVVCLVWLAAEYDVDKAWPYLMWLNQGQPVIADHLAEILSEAADDLDCHVQLVNWMANAKDERLINFFADFNPLPARYTMPGLVSRLLARPTAPDTGVWLTSYCRGTVSSQVMSLRPWRLLTAAWYATCFDPAAGLDYLRDLSDGEPTLSVMDNKILTEMATELDCALSLTRWIAACPNPAVKTMLKDFGHPDLPTFVAATFQQPPNYPPLVDPVSQAKTDAETFQRAISLLEQAGVLLKTAHILDLACGLLASQAVLLHSSGYQTVGADLPIPPAYLPTFGFRQWLKRGKYVKAWKLATAPYYEALTQQTGLKLNWTKIKIELADLTRLQFPDCSFEVVLCFNYLHRAPDVEGLLAEAARVLKPGGLFMAQIHPFSALTGAFSPDGVQPWAHLRSKAEPLQTDLRLNQWRESQYRATLEKFFIVEQWQTEPDNRARTLLTPAIQAELSGYDESELTCQQIVVAARKS